MDSVKRQLWSDPESVLWSTVYAFDKHNNGPLYSLYVNLDALEMGERYSFQLNRQLFVQFPDLPSWIT